MGELVGIEKFGRVAVILIDNPPVNALSTPVRQRIRELVAECSADRTVDAMVIACAGKTFVAGADITEFGKPLQEPTLPQVWEAIEASEKPVVAALHGTALGGGLEMAMACNYRYALKSAQIGLPEVNLGLLPGAGGTQRLPRLIGVEKALEVILSGRTMKAEEALASGAIDRMTEGELLPGAVAFAAELATSGGPHPKVSAITIPPASLPEGYFEAQRSKVARQFPGLMAKAKIVDCLEASVTMEFAKGQARERELFLECRASPQSAALRHVFFASREVSKIPGIGSEVSERPIARAGVVGAGRMGGGIAVCLADAGICVTLLDADEGALKRGLAEIGNIYRGLARRGKLTEEEAGRRLARITPACGWESFSDADLIIEAAFEAFEVKEGIFRSLDRVAKPGAILASNTSSLNLDEIAAVTSRPADVVGLHFFNPANVMPLLEVVKGRETSPEVVKSCFSLAKSIGKTGVLSGVCFGFIGNRMLARYTSECSLMMLEGVAPERLDMVMTSFGMAMGPNAVADLIGLDVRLNVLAEAEKNGLGEISRWPRAIAEALAGRGRLGRKTGAGFYRYPEGSDKPVFDGSTAEILSEVASACGVSRKDVSDDEIVERVMCQLASEGARILDEGIALRPGDVDVVWIKGYGFPSWRGGPMHWAESYRLDRVASAIAKYRDAYGLGQWAESKLLANLASKGRTFSDAP